VTGGRCRFYYVQGGKSHLETGRSGGLREEKPRQHVFGAMEPHADICVHSTRRQEGTGGNVLPVVLARADARHGSLPAQCGVGHEEKRLPPWL
jgi:hypothetical protein